jgi:NAD(P)-dependent dehydrogenase (short-subunit alcohol dehydrogenase family)
MREAAIVTGGGSGLGRGLSLALAAGGTDVFVWGRRQAPLEETCGLAEGLAGSIVGVQCDVRSTDQVERALGSSQIDGRVPSILVNNAAGAYVQSAEEITERGWTAVLESSLSGVFIVSQQWCRARVDAGGGGVILNITSATVDNGSPGTAHSGAAKAGVASLTKTLAVEWARFGIRVNALAPGAFRTDGADTQIWSDGKVEERILRAVPLGRLGTIDDIVQPALFLVGPGAGYVTGATLKVDGGWTLSDWLYQNPTETDQEKL